MHRAFRYYDLIMGAFVAVLLCSNLIGPAKVVELKLPFFGLTQFGAGNLFFPLSYIFGDILTEVYGYALSRRVIWTGFAAMSAYCLARSRRMRMSLSFFMPARIAYARK